MSSKPAKQLIIDTLAREMSKGNGFETVLKLAAKKWNLSRTTFHRYWAKAKLQVNENSEFVKEKVLEATIQAEIDAFVEVRKYDIITAAEKRELLTKVLRGRKKFTDIQLRALAELNKMDGDYSPTKKDLNLNIPDPPKKIGVILPGGETLEI